jgi:hypothetical protein
MLVRPLSIFSCSFKDCTQKRHICGFPSNLHIGLLTLPRMVPLMSTLNPPALDAEGEDKIRRRLGRYGLGKLFDVGGGLYCAHIATRG